MPAVGAATTTDAGRRRTPATPDPLVTITSDGDLVLVDAVSGTVVRTVREGVAPDGYVVAGWGDHPFGTDVVALDVTDEHLAPTVQAGRVVGPDRSEGAVPSGWHAVTTLPDGSLAVAGSEEPDGAPARGPDTMGDEVRDDASFLAVVDPATGDVVRKVTVPDVSASSLRASPDGRHVVFRGRAYDPGTGTWTATLRRWDVLTGTVEEVPRTDPLARGR